MSYPLKAFILLSLCTQALSAAPIITTGAPQATIAVFGSNQNTETFGQVFIPTGPETVLNSFQFMVQSATGFTFRAYIQEFNQGTGTTTGSILFAGASTGFSLASGQLETFTFTPGALALTANTPYIAYLSTLQEPPVATQSQIGFIIPPAVNANPNLESGLRRTDTDTFGATGPTGVFTLESGRLAFTANLSAAAAPELNAATAALPACFLGGLLVICLDRRRRLA